MVPQEEISLTTCLVIAAASIVETPRPITSKGYMTIEETLCEKAGKAIQRKKTTTDILFIYNPISPFIRTYPIYQIPKETPIVIHARRFPWQMPARKDSSHCPE
jgi:hypothetical protein